MTFKALVYAYVLGGLTFIPLVIIALISFTIYTSVPVGDIDPAKVLRGRLEHDSEKKAHDEAETASSTTAVAPGEVNDLPRPRKGWLTIRRTFEESTVDGSYVTLVRSFLDARSKDPKKSRPKDMWYVVLKGKVLYLYEDEGMIECEAVLELSGHDVLVYPEDLLDGELFAKRNAICLRPKDGAFEGMPSLTREMKLDDAALSADIDVKTEKEKEEALQEKQKRDVAREAALNISLPWFIFVRTNVEMEDWYFALIHASDNPANSPTLAPLAGVFKPSDMHHLVATLDEQPDVIPMRWLNALIGRLFFSYYRTQILESYIIGRLMKKLSKVKRPAFLTDIVVTEVSVGNTAPTLSKPMLKELTKEGDASLEVQLRYKGEVRITIEATATINLGARFKSYTVKLVLAAVLREIEGNLLIKVKRPPSNRIWYAFTAPPRIVLDVEPIVSDRQITWGMVLSTIESRVKEIIQESVVMPNMDDIAFFESSQYLHRGGIWEDAARRDRPAATATSDTGADDVPTLTTVPSIDTIDVTSTEPEASNPKRSQSAEALHANANPSKSSIPMPRSVSQEVKQSSLNTVDATSDSSGTTRNRRRTWFSSVGSADLATLKDGIEAEDVTSEPSRGRSVQVETTLAPRSQSTPDSPRDEKPASGLKPAIELREDRLYPERQPRSSSRQSRSSTSSIDGELIDPSEQTLSRTTSTSSRGLPTSPSGSTFFSTLKSRAAAADKQAISNQAKEAIRKWGVNWGGMRKDTAASVNATSSITSEESPDAVPSDARLPTDSQKKSYAEVRAAVAERKEREKSALKDSTTTSAPIAIPEGGRIKVRSVSVSSGNIQMPPSSPSFSAVSTSPCPSLTKQNSISPSGTPKLVAPAMSRTTTSSHSHDPFVEDGQEPGKRPNPVQTQPSQARTMTIPGIHASHRGEVMSMGYVAPAPQPSLENTMKSPAIQTVYRLWKSPSNANPEQQDANQVQDQVDGSADANKDVAPMSLSSEISEAPRSKPPPLPPRSIPAKVQELPAEPTLERAASPASEALKSIATKDDNQRSPPRSTRSSTQDVPQSTDTLAAGPSPETLGPTPSTGQKPPLPPRRTPSVIS